MTAAPRPRLAVREVCAVAALLGVALLLMASRYGPHRDELYFASAGQRLAWGDPDQPILTPFLARVAATVHAHDLVLLRVPSMLAMCGLVVLGAAFARLLGGGRAAQVLTAVVIAASAVVAGLGHRLSTATFDTLVWTALLLVVAHACVDDRPRLWLLAGLLAGIGLENKHGVAFLLVGVLVGLAAVPETRGRLRTPYPWLAALIALLLWAPNLAWQATHGWPVLVLSGQISQENGGLGGRIGFVAQALLMFSPVIAVVWVYGLVQLLRRREWVLARPVAVAFLTVAVVFLVVGGKGYYVAGAVPPLVAAGCTALAQRWSTRSLVVRGAVLALSGLFAWPALVPVLPAHAYAASFYTGIDADQLETIGWPAEVADVRRALAGLPPTERARAVVFTINYGEAGAMEWYGVGRPVYSGHNGWGDWGPPPEGARPVVVVGESTPDADFDGCHRVATVRNRAGADNEENGHGVWVCAGPRGSWAARWPRLVHLDA